MRVWVDCTAAAHPLVLRPIVERLEARGHEVEVTARDYGADGRRSSSGSGSSTGRRPPRRRRRPPARALALAAPQRGARALGAADGASTSRSPTARSTSRSSPRCCGSRPRRCRTTSGPGLQRQISWRAARRVIVPDAIPVERLRARRRAGGEAVSLSRPQGGLLPRRLRARRPGARRARARPRPGPGGGPAAAGDLGLPRAELALRARARPARRRRRRRPRS